jgi:hypothetical protein
LTRRNLAWCTFSCFAEGGGWILGSQSISRILKRKWNSLNLIAFHCDICFKNLHKTALIFSLLFEISTDSTGHCTVLLTILCHAPYSLRGNQHRFNILTIWSSNATVFKYLQKILVWLQGEVRARDLWRERGVYMDADWATSS